MILMRHLGVPAGATRFLVALGSAAGSLALSSLPAAGEPPGGFDCGERRLKSPPRLSMEGAERSQFRTIVKAVEAHGGIQVSARDLAAEFASCVEQLKARLGGPRSGDDDRPWGEVVAGLEVRISGNGSSLDIEHGARSASFHMKRRDQASGLPARVDAWLAKDPDKAREPALRRLAWYLWVESLLSRLDERYNHYVYADELIQERAAAAGRSFQPGFLPEFREGKLFVASIRDQDLARQGLEAGAEIQAINGRGLGRWTRPELRALWYSPRPFQYAVRTVDDTGARQISGSSIPVRHQTLWHKLLGGSGYIRIRAFSRESLIELRRALREMEAARVNGLILDLRDNRGGRVSHGLVDCFLKPGQVVISYQDMNPEAERVDVPATVEYFGAPLVLLVNEGTASMAEMLAASLKANSRATLVGAPTRGKAVAQAVQPIRGEGELHVVSTRYFYPGTDESWTGTGIEPHVLVELTSAEEDAVAGFLEDPEPVLEEQIMEDRVLKQALGLLEAGP